MSQKRIHDSTKQPKRTMRRLKLRTKIRTLKRMVQHMRPEFLIPNVREGAYRMFIFIFFKCYFLIMEMSLKVQYLSLKCCPQHGGWRWQPLIAQVLAGKSKAIRPCTTAYNWLKLQRNIIAYLMRCWKCCPPSATQFWHVFRKCSCTLIISISEISVNFTHDTCFHFF